MKVLLVNGSPNGHGCTYTALKEIEKTLRAEGVETEMFYLGNKPIGGCLGCGACKKLGKCVQEDVVNKLLPKALEADGIVLGAPVHYASAAGETLEEASMVHGMDCDKLVTELNAYLEAK